MTSQVGLRELRQGASELVRRAEAGERLIVTVAGRPAALLGPAEDRRWRHWNDIAPIFHTPIDAELADDLSRLDGDLRDPWAHG